MFFRCSALLALALSAPLALAQPPVPTAPGLTDTPTAPPNTEATRIASIARDDARMFGSDPDNPGPLAKDLSPAIKPAAIEKAVLKVADWQLAQTGQYFRVADRVRQLDGRIWTWAALYDGYLAAADEFRQTKYRDAMEAMGKAYNWQLITHPPPPRAAAQKLSGPTPLLCL